MSPAKSGKLEDQAATAALYVTKGRGAKDDKPRKNPLDADGKLSSASAATSLKHASPQDLPAYPVVGLQNIESSAGAAASLANANHKSFEYWKPGEIPAANRAAYLAKDYKADPLWKPELSAAGSKAALLAHKDGADVKIWRPSDTDAGQSAAGQAMRKKGLSPQLDYGHTADGEKRAMMAATGAMSGNRKRSDSTPVASSSYPDSKNSAANALKAATSANRPARGQPAPAVPPQASFNAGRVHNQAITNLSREMYTSHPPVAPEVEEKNKQDTLRAAAVSMAKKMYEVQQRQSEEAAALRRSDSQYAAASANDRPQSTTSSIDTGPPQYANLQEAARKLASERLANLHDEHAAYRNYYGTEKPQHRKLSIRGRRRASSDGQTGESDEERSRQIRNEMSLFTDKLAQVDGKKRKQDRDSLMAAAQRNVRASMNAQDARVFNETGKVSPAMMADWETKAKAKAEADSEHRLANHGMVNIGGGKFLDQSEVDAIAAAKVQPTLDDITQTAEKHRARDEELRQQQLERDRIAAEKNADDKERAARTKEEWRRFREEEKREEKAKKDDAKAKKAEEKRLRDEEKHKSREKKVSQVAPEAAAEDKPAEGTEEALAKLVGPFGKAGKKPSADKAEQRSPSVEPLSGTAPASTQGTDLVPATNSDSIIQPVAAAETGETPPATLASAEEIAQRVFSAPVEGETKPLNHVAEGDADKETKEIAAATSNTKDAPVVGMETTSAPVTEVVSKKPESTMESAPATESPLASRIAPSTETTVSSPFSSKSPKDKESKVSSWLKTKFSRRANPTSPSATDEPSNNRPIISEPKDPKVFVGGADLGSPDEKSKFSSDQGDSSMREIALVGRNTALVDAPVVSPTESDDPTAQRGLAHRDDDDDSTSISSLSSDEDVRGRSAVRLADIIPGNEAPIFGSTAATHDRPAPEAPSAGGEKAGEPLDPALPGATERQPSSVGATTEDYEEAKDTFDSERLVPPEKGVIGRDAQKSDSPARDSKFVEEL